MLYTICCTQDCTVIQLGKYTGCKAYHYFAHNWAMNLLPSSLFYLPPRCSFSCIVFAFWQIWWCILGVKPQSNLTSSLIFMATTILSMLILKRCFRFLSFLSFLFHLLHSILCYASENKRKQENCPGFSICVLEYV